MNTVRLFVYLIVYGFRYQGHLFQGWRKRRGRGKVASTYKNLREQIYLFAPLKILRGPYTGAVQQVTNSLDSLRLSPRMPI